MKRWEIYLELFIEFIGIIFGTIVFVFVIPKILGFMWPFVVGWIVSMIANPLCKFLENKLKIRKKVGSAVIVVFVIGIIVGIFYLVIAKLGYELVGLITELPDMYNSISVELTEIGNYIMSKLHKLPPDIIDTINSTFSNLQQELGTLIGSIASSFLQNIGGLAKGISNGFIAIVVIIMSSYFFLAERDRINSTFYKNTSEDIKVSITMIKNKLTGAVGGYIKAQIKIMFIICIILMFGLMIANVEYSFLLAVIISVLDAFPIIGSWMALIPWAIVCMFSGEIQKGIILVITYIVCALARQFIQPKIVGDSVGMSPLATLVFMYIGLKLKGFIGFILAMVIGIIVINLYRLGLFDNKIDRIKKYMTMLKKTT